MEENLKNHWLSKISEINKENRAFFENVPVRCNKTLTKTQTEPWLHFFGTDCSVSRISIVMYKILRDAKERFLLLQLQLCRLHVDKKPLGRSM